MIFDPGPIRRSFERKERAPAQTLNSASMQVERKRFFFELQENPRGTLLRITEEAGGRRNSIVIPATGLTAFHQVLRGLVP